MADSYRRIHMRTRLTLLLVGIVLMAVFAALNWSEFVRPAQISWGWRIGEAPLGLVMLALLVLWVGFLIGSAYLETRYQLAAHRNSKLLEAQRVLADKAEASRFTELRSYLESQTALAVQRELATTGRLEQAVHQERSEMMGAMDRLSRKLAAYSGEMARSEGATRDGRSPH
jgi:multisubunit Na+/H+ antiporter MnhG subunit